MVNIIYDKSNSIRFTQFNATSCHDLTELRIFVPKTNVVTALYCIVRDSEGKTDSAPLIQISCEQKDYYCYGFDCAKSISVESGSCSLMLFGLYQNGTPLISSEFAMNLKVENFNITNQLYVITKLSGEIANCYNKIVKFTEMNVNILSDVKEVAESVGVK